MRCEYNRNKLIPRTTQTDQDTLPYMDGNCCKSVFICDMRFPDELNFNTCMKIDRLVCTVEFERDGLQLLEIGFHLRSLLNCLFRYLLPSYAKIEKRKEKISNHRMKSFVTVV